ncbi:hypothetical protein HUU51_02050 [Candidatus Gracilibacteria bacterium]|nr:hypothetical protein [Candidatus Gracilibacteria bacterium]
MIDKPGGWTGGWGGFPREELKNTEKGKSEIGRPKKVEWRLGHTLAEVEELLKKEKQKKN